MRRWYMANKVAGMVGAASAWRGTIALIQNVSSSNSLTQVILSIRSDAWILCKNGKERMVLIATSSPKPIKSKTGRPLMARGGFVHK